MRLGSNVAVAMGDLGDWLFLSLQRFVTASIGSGFSAAFFRDKGVERFGCERSDTVVHLFLGWLATRIESFQGLPLRLRLYDQGRPD